jgi:tetratricopeptide (TPR) repeat protein
MKGKNLVSLVLSLDEHEYKHVYDSLFLVPHNRQLGQVFQAIRTTEATKQKSLSTATGIKERQIRVLLPKLAPEIIYLLGIYQPDLHIQLDAALATAYKLVFRMANDPGAELIQDLFDKAFACDRFDIMLEVHRLSEIMTSPVSIRGLSRAEVNQKHLNLLQYQELKEEVSKVKKLPITNRLAAIKRYTSLDLLSHPGNALSVTAKAHFHWIWTRIHFFRENFPSSCSSQGNLVSLLDRHKWLNRNNAFFYPDEHRLLTYLLVASGQEDEAYKMLFKVGNTDPLYQLTDLAKWQHIYPLKLDMAIDAGDVEKGKSSMQEILSLLKENSNLFPAKFVTQILYKCSYFMFSIGDFAEAQKLNLKLQTAYKSVDFYRLVLPMVRIMAAVIAFEVNDQVEMGRQDKNFRMTSAYQEAGYYKSTLGILKRLAGLNDSETRSDFLEDAMIEIEETLQDHHSRLLNRIFDFEVWLQSKAYRCSMAEIFCNRKSLLPQNSSLEAI